jgi:4-amino-4-deoxy-L-arabinose transferase-like glycosyltransferase
MLSVIRKLDNRIVFIMIPLILSAFTHLWNVAQFPSFHPDEGVYIRRALHILAGLGLQDPSSRYDHSQDSTSSYDHPYFGPLFLAGIFKILGYPQNLNTTPDVASIETLSSVPRIIMGVLAILDTFLVYRISERRYNSKVALFAAVLFAVMPLSWFTRRVVLDSIMLPFVLTSVLLILEIRSNPKYAQTLSVLSGICLGLAIFTKIPAFTLIPLIAYLIYQNIDRKKFPSVDRLKILTIWLLPVILIPIIWPVYAFLSGDINEWIDGVFWQSAGRQNKGKSLLEIVSSAWKSDPVLLILGAAGTIYLTIRRDFFPIIWIIPYLSLLFLVGWVTHFHLILIIPILCISIAKMIYDLPAIMPIKKNIPISTIIISGISLFGLISSAILISTNLSYVQFEAAAYISNALVPTNGSFITKNHTNINLNYNNDDDINQITVISSPIFSWVFKYVFNDDNTFAHVRDTQPIKTEKLVLLVDSTYKHVIRGVEGENATQVQRLMNLYNNTEIVALFKDDPSNYNKKDYPFTGIDSANIGSRTEEIRTNY